MMKYAEGRVVPTDHQWNAHQLMETIVLFIHLPQLIWTRTLSACFLLERQQFYWLSGALIICLMVLFPLGSLRQRAWLHTNKERTSKDVDLFVTHSLGKPVFCAVAYNNFSGAHLILSMFSFLLHHFLKCPKFQDCMLFSLLMSSTGICLKETKKQSFCTQFIHSGSQNLLVTHTIKAFYSKLVQEYILYKNHGLKLN